MIGGAPVDIRTGRPHAPDLPESRAEAEAAAAEELSKALAAGVSESAAAQQVLSIIEAALAERIEAILAEDPQALAFAAILKRLGAARVTGEIAAREFVRRRLMLRPGRPIAVTT